MLFITQLAANSTLAPIPVVLLVTLFSAAFAYAAVPLMTEQLTNKPHADTPKKDNFPVQFHVRISEAIPPPITGSRRNPMFGANSIESIARSTEYLNGIGKIAMHWKILVRKKSE